MAGVDSNVESKQTQNPVQTQKKPHIKQSVRNSSLTNGNVDGDSKLGQGDSEPPLTNGHTATSNGDHQVDVSPPVKIDNQTTEQTVEASDNEQQQDIVLIQETGFMIKIHTPGNETFEMPVSSMELVQEIYQVLIDREDTCHRTCFSLQLDGVTLDNFAELKAIEGLKEGSIIKVVEESYTVREARIHVRHVRDLLKSVDLTDAYHGTDCNSLAFLNVITGGDAVEKKNHKTDSSIIDFNPPDFILPGNKDRPLLTLHPTNKHMKTPDCVKVLTYSGWNPPPGNRRMHGDLLYLYLVTLEDKRYHITSSTKGFYINQSTQDEFNPNAATPYNHLSHSLIGLLNQISPLFKKNFSTLLKKRSQKHPYERVATPYQVFSWLSPSTPHNMDYIRAEDAFSSRLGYEEHIPGQTRDWNEELQTTRELPRKNLPERLIRERAIFKVHSDFVVGATRGAMAVIDGNIMAINPGEDSKMQMFLWNSIFFSLGFDVKDHYKEFGGDAAAYVAPSNDLQGVRAYASVDADGLYTLGTVVVDYRGYRVTAQSIIPGILEREQEHSVVYGSVDFGKSIASSDKYKELLEKTAANLKIRPHKVVNDKEEVVELFSSMECKGIIGNDGRHYVLDLLRTFPPDVNYLDTVPLEDFSKEVRDMGFPHAHPHRIVCLRHELIDAFVENRYVAFVKHAAFQFQQIRLQKIQDAEQKKKESGEKEQLAVNGDSVEGDEEEDKKDEIEAEEAKKIVEALTDTSSDTFQENTKEIVKKAAAQVGSLHDSEFNIAFNPDVYQHHVKHFTEGEDTMKREQQLVLDAAQFLLTHQIPNFIRDCLEHTSSPIDGYTLAEALHHNGINMRYLGKVTEIIGKYQQLSYLFSICISELICRSAKHLFKSYMQGVEMMNLSAAISHFLNCFLGACSSPHTQVAADELQRSKKKSKRRNKGLITVGGDNHEWALETPKTLWRKIMAETKHYFTFTLEGESMESAIETYELQKVSLLRSFCKKLGIQLFLREYNMENSNKQAFGEEDIINMFPVVKHIHPKATDAYHVFTTGQQKIQQGLLRDGFELISEAMNLLNNVYGAMHPEIAACARLLARLNYIMGDYGEALAYQQRAVLMSERVLGIDHPNTITEYAHMALYSFANNQISNALKLMYRSRYLVLLCHGENHPEVALFDSNIGLMLQAVEEYDLSLRFLQKALELNSKFFGTTGLKVAMSYHLVARAHSCKGDFRTALINEKEAYTIYKQLLGEDHERTKESSECLRHLTTQAVKFQKTMNEIYKGEKGVTIPPLEIHTPSLANVLDTLNLINGIVFVHISQEDIDRFKAEMVRRQQQGQASVANDDATPKDTNDSSSTSSLSSPSSSHNDTSDSPTASR